MIDISGGTLPPPDIVPSQMNNARITSERLRHIKLGWPSACDGLQPEFGKETFASAQGCAYLSNTYSVAKSRPY